MTVPIDHWVPAHQTPTGPGDSRPTASTIIASEHLQNAWPTKTILITGCSSGLGVSTAQALAETGATLYLTARDIPKAQQALGPLAQSPKVHLLHFDLASLSAVRQFAADFLKQCPKLNVFIANAGVMACPESRTEDGFETQFATNHLAHFLLLHLLTPALRSAAESSPETHSRVVILTSLGHRFGSVNFDNYNLDGIYDPNAAYSQSKTANLWTAAAYDRKFKSYGVRAWAVHPGGIATGLGKYMSEEMKEGLVKHEYLTKTFKDLGQGAATTVWASCAAALEGKGGEYLENCQLAGPWKEGSNLFAPGYAKHATDEGAQERLWVLSQKLVGIEWVVED